jgi:hypothetical protein
VEAQEFEHRLDRGLDIAQNDFGSVVWEFAIYAEQKSNARTVDELHAAEIHLGAADSRIDSVLEMSFDRSGGTGIEAGEAHRDVKGIAHDVCLEFIGHNCADPAIGKD